MRNIPAVPVNIPTKLLSLIDLGKVELVLHKGLWWFRGVGMKRGMMLSVPPPGGVPLCHVYSDLNLDHWLMTCAGLDAALEALLEQSSVFSVLVAVPDDVAEFPDGRRRVTHFASVEAKDVKGAILKVQQEAAVFWGADERYPEDFQPLLVLPGDVDSLPLGDYQ